MSTKAVIYARVSSEDQKRDGFSIPAQLDLLREFAEKHNIEVVKEFEEAETAKEVGRTQFNAMLNFLKTHKNVNTILCEKTDRLYRNIADSLKLDVRKTNYTIYFVKEGVVLSPKINSHEMFMHNLKVIMATNFIENLREETKKGINRKIKEGYFVSKPPYGYKKIDKNISVIDIETAPFVKQAFTLYAQGLSLDVVRDRLKDEGYIYRKNCEKIDRSQLHKMLKNYGYLGYVTHKGEISPGKHTPIISEELFFKVQKQFKKDGKPDKRLNHAFAFSGLLKCAECGSTITSEIKKGKYIYYHCSGGRCKCPQKKFYIREEELEKQFDEAVMRVQISEKHYEYIKQALKESFEEKKEYDKSHRDIMQAQISRIQTRLDKLYEDKLDGQITTEEWLTKKNKWTLDKEELQEKILAYV